MTRNREETEAEKEAKKIPLTNKVSPDCSWDIVTERIVHHYKGRVLNILSREEKDKVDRNYPESWHALARCYHSHAGHERIQASVVLYWAKVCAINPHLCHFHFSYNFIDKILPLLSKPLCRLVVLQALLNITITCSAEHRLIIAKKTTRPLLSFLRTIQPRDLDNGTINPKVIDFTLRIVTRTAFTAILFKKDPQTDIVLENYNIDLKEIIDVIADRIHHPTSTYTSYFHCIYFIRAASASERHHISASKSILHFIIATLRSKNLHLRLEALSTIMLICRPAMEPDPQFNLFKLWQALKKDKPIPPHIANALRDKSDAYKALDCYTDLRSAMDKVTKDKNLHTLALTLSALVMKSENCISACEKITQLDAEGKPSETPYGLPFRPWVDALPHCALVLENRADPLEKGLSEILKLKYMLMEGEVGTRTKTAGIALENDPESGFCSFARAQVGGDEKIRLRSAKRGLKCNGISQSLKVALLRSAFERGFLRVQFHLVRREYTECAAAFKICLEDSTEYVKACPVDAIEMTSLLPLHILLRISGMDNKLSPDLAEIKSLLDQLKLVNETFEFLYEAPFPEEAEHRRAVEMIVPNYAAAMTEWGPTIERLEAQSDIPEPAEPKMEELFSEANGLSFVWLSEVELVDSSVNNRPEMPMQVPKVNWNAANAVICAYCRNPAVQKSVGCKKCNAAKFCDRYCESKSNHDANCGQGP